MKSTPLLAACAALTISVGASAQKSNADYLKDLEAAGYPDLKPYSFADTKKKYALTGLYKSDADKDPLLHFAEIQPTKDGANMLFRVYRPCVPTEKEGRLQERIIMVSGQKIEVYYACGIAPHETRTNEVFVIKSPAGNDFAKKAFADWEYVFVHLNGLPVPFATEGFTQVLRESSGKAL